MDLHSLISHFSYIAIFILMIANGIINFPSSQLLYLICGVFVANGTLHFLPTVIIGALGNTLGNIIAYSLIKKYEHTLARKLLLMNEETFRKIHSALHETFSHKGMWWIFVGKLTPSVKAFVPTVAGLASTKRTQTSLIFLFSSLIWATAIVALGYTFGEYISLSSFLGVSLLVGGIILYILYKNISKKLSHTK